MSFVPQLPRNVADWGVSLPSLFDAALTRKVRDQMKNDYTLPAPSTLTTFADQVEALCNIRAAAVKASNKIRQQREEYRDELREHGLLKRPSARGLAATIVDNALGGEREFSEVGEEKGAALPDEREASGAPVLFTSRAELVLQKYDPATGTAKDVIVNPDTFKNCCCCHGDHLFGDCESNNDEKCKQIFFDNLHKLKPGLKARWRERHGNDDQKTAGNLTGRARAAHANSVYGPGNDGALADVRQHSLGRGRS